MEEQPYQQSVDVQCDVYLIKAEWTILVLSSQKCAVLIMEAMYQSAQIRKSH